MKKNRSKALAAVLLVVAAACLWIASRMAWAKVYVEDGLSEPRTIDVHGSDWSPWLIAVALVLLAAMIVQVIFSGIVARIVAVIVAVLGIVVAIPAISLLVSGENNLYAAQVIDLAARDEVVAVTTATLPGLVVLLAALCAVIAGVAMMGTARERTGGSSKYQTPAARRDELERRVFAERDAAAGQQAQPQVTAQSERELWDSLDHGVDPTD